MMDEITRQVLVDRIENVILDYESRQLNETDFEDLNYEDLKCISESLQYAQRKTKQAHKNIIKWHSVEKEGLPKQDGTYLVTMCDVKTDKKEVVIRRYLKGFEEFDGMGIINSLSVTKTIAWAEMPEPWEGE